MLWEDRGSGNVRLQLISSLREEPQLEGSTAAANMTSDTVIIPFINVRKVQVTLVVKSGNTCK